MIRMLIVVFVLVLSQFAWGANTNIQNGDSNLITRGKLNVNFDQQYNVKNAPYNAAGTGLVDDYAAINSAMSDACAANGGIIYFPPGTYQVNTALVPCVSSGGGGLIFRGAGRFSSKIACTKTGFCIDKQDTGTQLNALLGIESIAVGNNRADPDAGAIRLSSNNAGTYIRDCDIGGYTGIVVAADQFTTSISDCTILGGNAYAPNSVGIYISQGEVHNIKMGGWNIGIAVGAYNQPGQFAGATSSAPVTHIYNMAVETSSTGIFVGATRGPVVTASITGSTMHVTAYIDGPKFTIGQQIFGFTTPLPANTTIANCPGGDCGATGDYPLNQSAPAGSQTIYTFLPSSGSTGLTVDSVQTEAINIGFLILGMTAGTLSNSTVTSTNHGADQFCTSATYSAAASGTFTFTCLYTFGMTGSHECTSESWSNGGYNFDNQTCDFTGGNVVTITGRGASPGGSATGGSISPATSACVLARTMSRVTFNAINCSVGHTLQDTSFDFTWLGDGAQDHITLLNLVKSQGFAVLANDKAAFTMVNSPDFVLGMHFADLPGQTGVIQPGPYAGQTYYIVDANQATLGGNVTAGGAPNTNGYVTYNGTNWTLTSK